MTYLTKTPQVQTFTCSDTMSRIGKKTIAIHSGVTCTLDANTNTLSVKGKLGELKKTFLPFIKINQTQDTIHVEITNPEDRFQNAMWGTARALILNMIVGVNEGYKKELELNGVGFRMESTGKQLKLALGYSHPILVDIPDAVKIVIDKNLLTATSHDKEALGHFVQYVHDLKPCDPYKHKGFKYPGKYYPKKVGKKMVTAK